MTPQYGCAGLCAGDGCRECERLADQITAAKRAPHGPRRDALLQILADRVAAAMGVRAEVAR